MPLISLETLKQTLCRTPFFLQHQLSLQVQNSHIEIRGLGSYRQPQAGQLIFLKKFSLPQALEEYETVFQTAKAFLLHETFHRALFAEKNNFPKALLAKGYLFSNHPEWLFHLLLSHFDPYKVSRPAYPLPAIIDAKARAELATKGIVFDGEVRVGPFVSLGRGCRIGAGVSLLGHNSLGENCSLGDGVTLHPGVMLYANTELGARTTVHSGTVIGADGFGYEMIKGALLKIPQIGRVVVEEEVEIGANVTIDRATVGETRIGKGVKVDNLVQIAHNVEIGAGALIVSQVGIGGSSLLGKGVILAGQAGIADHCVLGAGAQLGAQSGLMPGKRVPPGAVWFGSPALPARQRLKMELALQRLGRARAPQ